MSFDQNRNRVADGIERGGDKLGEAIRPSSYSQTRQYGRDLKEDVKEGARDARDGTKAFGNELREDMREGAQDAKDAAHRAKEAYKATPTPPAYSDIAKAATDLLNKDFYHVAAANLEVKSKVPNGLAYTIKGKSAHDKPPTASIEGKKTVPDTGISLSSARVASHTSTHIFTYPASVLWMVALSPTRTRSPKKTSKAAPDADDHKIPHKPQPSSVLALICFRSLGMTGTVTWSTFNQIDAKLEADENLAKGLKVEGVSSFKPDSQDVGAKLNFYFKQPAFNFRVMSDLLKGPTLNADLVLGHQGFLVGGEAGYDVQKAAVTRYSASVGFNQGAHTAALTATNNFSIFAASFYNKVNDQVELGANAAWDSKSSTTVGMELAAKYKVDPTSFFKGKVNDRGIAALAYNTKVNNNVTFGVGTSFDTQKLNEGTHKVGCHFAFEG